MVKMWRAGGIMVKRKERKCCEVGEQGGRYDKAVCIDSMVAGAFQLLPVCRGNRMFL